MKLVKYRMFPVWSFDKEEAWLNHMAAKGWTLSKIFFLRYEFTKTQPGEYNIRLELLDDDPTTDKNKEYIDFLETTGAEHIATYVRWVYFRKKSSLGPFDLYSDVNSRVAHLDRIIKFLVPITLLLFAVGIPAVLTSRFLTSDIGWINITIGCLFTYGFWRLYQKKQQLLKDRDLFE